MEKKHTSLRNDLIAREVFILLGRMLFSHHVICFGKVLTARCQAMSAVGCLRRVRPTRTAAVQEGFLDEGAWRHFQKDDNGYSKEDSGGEWGERISQARVGIGQRLEW